jgi:uncharacterized membrane protein YeaQ/YmgE (transglycosylase-associated protein family)
VAWRACSFQADSRWGCYLTMILGLVGSVVGDLISTAIFGYSAADSDFHTGGLIMSIIGAVIVLVIYVTYAQRRLS